MPHTSARRAIKLVRLLTFAAGRQGLRHGVAAAVEHWRPLSALDVRTVVDVGANKGQFALLANGVFPDATIYSFEPLQEPAARFRATLGADVTLFETAIGPSDTEAIIYVSQRMDSSSLLPITKQREIFPGTDCTEERVVSVAPLPKYLSPEHIKPPALLKIDVQGYELEVLKGCDPLLMLFQFVYLESSFVELYGGQALVGEIILHLLDRKFQLSGVYNQVEDSEGRPVQADFLFTNSDGHDDLAVVNQGSSTVGVPFSECLSRLQYPPRGWIFLGCNPLRGLRCANKVVQLICTTSLLFRRKLVGYNTSLSR